MNARLFRGVCVSCAFLCTVPIYAQNPHGYRVDPRNMYERVLAVLPVVGSGTMADPKRGMYVPATVQMNPASRSGILGYQCVESDDRKLMLCEFVAKDRAAFQPILADSTVKSFLKGRDKLEDAIAEFTKHKKNFDFSRFGVIVP